MMKKSFFEKIDWAAFWVATLTAFGVYFFTLGPSVGLEDSGELITASAHLGVPHPPGYPFWTLCSWIFCKLFFWVSYMGHPNPAWPVACFSAVAGAFAAGCTAMLICRSSRDFIFKTEAPAEDCLSNYQVNKWIGFGGGVGGALTFALSPVEWSQSTIVEIYSLNALFLTLVFLLSYKWMRRPTDKTLFWCAYVFGLGLTNYQVLVFAIVPLALMILMKKPGMFRDVLIYLIPVALTYQVLQIGSLQRADVYMKCDVIAKHAAITNTSSCPASWAVFLAAFLIIAALGIAIYFKSRNDLSKARDAIFYCGGAGVALLFFSSNVFTVSQAWEGVSAATAPLIDPSKYAFIGSILAASILAAVIPSFSGDDEKLTSTYNIKCLAVSGALAAVAALIALSVPMADLAGYQGEPYPWAKSTFVFICLIIAFFALSWFTPKGLCFAIPSAGLQITVFILLSRGAMNGLTHPQSWWFIWPIVWNFVLLAMACLTLPYGRSVAGAAFFTQLGVAFYVYMPIVSDLRNPPMNWGYPRTWEGFKHAIQRGQYEAIGVPKFSSITMFFEFLGGQMMHYFRDVKVQFTDFLLLFAPVPFIAGHWLVPANRRKTFWQWMIAVASCFIMMSLLLLLLAQVKGDLQDGFIQKVKFISSHAMIAIWIGYGLVFSGAIVMKMLSSRLIAGNLRYFPLCFAALAIIVAAAYPIVQNYTDKRLVFELGASEQNGHTFGWQFGAYQLDGHKAISQQLEADEEPLPDPSYPPPMDEFSVFFGGTDPGRFVPTYMIYAADFRPDIYLITQNALADDTYMSVQRDLYGDEIWIPAKEDSSEAFNIYLDEVQRGVRQANGDLKVENGRVQVTGALGVMEINGILTKMMFDREKFRRSFYIEESYPINWMYPYLSPHGLIMKINPRVMGYDRTLAQKDADFWDWYTRRLLNDPAFRRDFAGQKSFSKLRAALAGLYAKQRMRAQSAQAYREACLLYPASPESTFRYAQECLIHNRRFDVIRDIMDYTDSIDPNNKRTQRLREYVDNVENIMKKISTLEQKRSAKNNFTKIDAFILAQCYASIERNQEALDLIKPYAANVEQLDELKFLWPLFFKCNDMENAEKILTKLLRMRPGEDPVPWLTLARIQYRSGRGNEALGSLKTALTVNRDFTVKAIMSDGELKSIAGPLMRQQPQGR